MYYPKGAFFYQNTLLIKKYKIIKKWSVRAELTLVAAIGNRNNWSWIAARSIEMATWPVEITTQSAKIAAKLIEIVASPIKMASWSIQNRARAIVTKAATALAT